MRTNPSSPRKRGPSVFGFPHGAEAKALDPRFRGDDDECEATAS